MSFDRELTAKLLGDIGPLRFNPYVIKICKGCNTPNKVRYRGRGGNKIHYYCRKCIINRPEVKEKLSASTTNQWKNQAFVELVRQNSKANWTNQKLRRRMSKIHNDPQHKAATIHRNKTRHYDSEQISKAMKALWADQAYRNNLVAQIHKKKKSNDEIIALLTLTHGSRFDYSEVNYQNSHAKIKVRCTECNNSHYTFIHNHIRNGGCANCQISKGQREIIEFLRQYEKHIEINNRTVIHPLELDIYLPTHKLGIEYHGLFFHSYNVPPTIEQKHQHQQKSLLCRERGIKLFQIFSNEWDQKRPLLESMIKHRLGFASKIIGARNCELTNKVPNAFFTNNHLQGYRPASITLGLKYKDEICAAMSFSRHSKYEWEIIRYAVKSDMSISGGPSRLFKAFREQFNPTSILTYADLRYSTGDIYQKLGFIAHGHTKPNYFYTDKFLVFSRQSFQKHKLNKKLPLFDATKSEVVNCLTNGLRIGFDAGHTKWLWTSVKEESHNISGDNQESCQ